MRCPAILSPKPGSPLNLLFSSPGFHGVAPELVGQDVLAIQPVLHSHATDDNPRRVPFTGRADRLVSRRRQYIVESRGQLQRGECAGVAGIVDQLILVARRFRALFGHEYFTPLFPPGATRHSQVNSKSLNVFRVISSAPFTLATVRRVPSLISQPASGSVSRR